MNCKSLNQKGMINEKLNNERSKNNVNIRIIFSGLFQMAKTMNDSNKIVTTLTVIVLSNC